MGFKPGIATNSEGEGGSAKFGDSNAEINVNTSNNATIAIAAQQTHNETSPYARQNLLGLDIISSDLFPAEVRIIRITPNTLVASQSSSLPVRSQYRNNSHQAIIEIRMTCQLRLIDNQPAPMNTPDSRTSSMRVRKTYVLVMNRRVVENREQVVRDWCEHLLGEKPHEILTWADEEDIVQSLIRLERMVLVVDLQLDEDDNIVEEKHISIALETWSPGSIQTRRMADGSVRFKHRKDELILAARLRSPEWAGALLEEWLMDMRGEQSKPREKNRHITNMKRSRETIGRMLEQAQLTMLKDTMAEISTILENTEHLLADE